jgi:hypothetical protein
MRASAIGCSGSAPNAIKGDQMLATAFYFSLHGNIAVLIILAVCLVLILAAISVMLKD